ncbi:hypothetical protein PENTCL1PPCAC_19691, partial [Pristionchus entomophagus]
MGFNAIMAVCISIILFCSFSIIAHLRSQNVKWSGKTKAAAAAAISHARCADDNPDDLRVFSLRRHYKSSYIRLSDVC